LTDDALTDVGHDIEVVQRLLGHAELDHTDAYLQPSPVTLEGSLCSSCVLGR